MPCRRVGIVVTMSLLFFGCLHGARRSELPPPPPSAIWIESGQSEDDQAGCPYTIAFSAKKTAEEVTVDCTVSSPEPTAEWAFRFSIQDERGLQVHEDGVILPLNEGENVIQFVWNTAQAPTGVFEASLNTSQRGHRRFTHAVATVWKLAGQEIAAELDGVKDHAEALATHLASLDEPNPYSRNRLAIVTDALPEASVALERGDWPAAHELVRYLAGLTQKAQDDLGHEVPLAPEHDAPLCLFGEAGGTSLVEKLDRLDRYGLNAARIEFGLGLPGNGADPRAVGLALSAACGRAHEHGIRLTPALPLLGMIHPGNLVQETASPETPSGDDAPPLALLAEHAVKAALADMSDTTDVTGISIGDAPPLHATGEAFRAKFIAAMEERYGHRRNLNRNWTTRLAAFDDIEVSWDSPKTGYQRDLHTVHGHVLAETIEEILSATRVAASGVPVHPRLSDAALPPAERSSTIDPETLARLGDCTECGIAGSLEPRGPLSAYPRQAFWVTLLRSMAPGSPVYNTMDSTPLPNSGSVYHALHTLLWESAMAGGRGSLAPEGLTEPLTAPQAGRIQRLERLDAYATACKDLNRLAGPVAAFHDAPAEVAILWSDSAWVFDSAERLRNRTGAPSAPREYLDSVQAAFEGCSWFGHKVRFITERRCARGIPAWVRILVIPKTSALSDEAFAALQAYVQSGRVAIHTGTPIPHDPWGAARTDVLGNTPRTILLQGRETALDYLHAMDSANEFASLPPVSRAVTKNDYPLEGVKTRFALVDGTPYLYLVNLRIKPVRVQLTGDHQTGRDLIQGRDLTFPADIPPLTPMLIRLDLAEGYREGETEFEDHE